MKKVLVIVMVLSMVLAMTTAAFAGEDEKVYNLVFTTHNSDSNDMTVAAHEMADMLNEASNGRLNIEIYSGGTIAGSSDALTVTGEGGADMCWITVAQNASSLPISGFPYMPIFQYNNSYQSTYTMMKTVENFPQFAEEFAAQNVKLIGVHGAAPAFLVSRERSFADLSDWDKALVMSISANTIAILEAMGCSVMSDNPTQIYDSMSKGVYNSLLIDYQAVDAFGVSDIITSALDYNFGSVMGYVAMNLDVYNSLPADLQELLDSKFEEISLLFGGKMNESAIRGLTGHNFEIVEPSEEVKEAILKATEETVLPTYLSSCEAVGVDGQEIIDFAGKALEEAYEVYGAEYNWIK